MASGPSTDGRAPLVGLQPEERATFGALCRGGYGLSPPDTLDQWEIYHHIRREALLEALEYDFQHPETDEERVPGHFPLLLWSGDRPVGTIRVDQLEDGLAAFRLVAIDPTCQARGHGLELLQRAEAFARNLGCRAAVVYSTQEAAGFYARAGYVEEVWDTCCIGGIVQMRKQLT